MTQCWSCSRRTVSPATLRVAPLLPTTLPRWLGRPELILPRYVIVVLVLRKCQCFPANLFASTSELEYIMTPSYDFNKGKMHHSAIFLLAEYA